MYSLILGGLGFIGTNYIKIALKKKKIICIDNLSYAANLDQLKIFKKNNKFKFYKGNISNQSLIKYIFKNFKIDSIVNFAAETHVDNSITSPQIFVRRNVLDFTLFLEGLIKNPKFIKSNVRFLHISTDEVYGSLKLGQNKFKEENKFFTNSPYSASKASAEHFLRAWGKTFGLKYIIVNPSNNFGPFQNKEKFIPTIINSAINKKKIPIYGKGLNIRDWLYVEDNCYMIDQVLKNGKLYESYNIGGGNELSNIVLVKKICRILNELDKSFNYFKLISYVKDRPGHDFRYGVNSNKINKIIKVKKFQSFDINLKQTINWYLNNKKFLNK